MAAMEEGRGCLVASGGGVVDRRAETLLLTAQPRLRAWAASWVSRDKTLATSTTADDLVQTALVAALEQVKTQLQENGELPDWLDPADRLEAFLYGVLRHVTGRVARDPWTRRRLRLSSGAREELSFVAEPASDQHATPALEREQDRRRLESCFGTLEDTEQSVLWMYAAGRTYTQIAHSLQLSPSAVAKRRSRALDRLRARCVGCWVRDEMGCFSNDGRRLRA